MSKKGSKKEGKTVGYFQTDPTVTTIYVGNLMYKKSELDLKKMFDKYGKVKFVNLLLDDETKKSKGFAFVQMPNEKHAKAAIAELDGSQVDGRTLKVSIAKNRIPKDYVFKKKERVAKDSEEIIETEKKPKARKRDSGLKLLFDHLGK